jgi:hypothetical protein
MYRPDPKPWLKPTIYYGRRYIPGYVKVVTLQDRASGRNVVEFNTYDVANTDRKRAIYSALPKITNMFLFEYASGNVLDKHTPVNLIPLSGATLEIWGYNFSELPITRPHLNTLSVWVSGTIGVFNDDLYETVDKYNIIPVLSGKNPEFRGITVPYKLLPVPDRTKSVNPTGRWPGATAVHYTRKNKLKLQLPAILIDDGCIDIIVGNAAGYTTLNTLTNDYICAS